MELLADYVYDHRKWNVTQSPGLPPMMDAAQNRSSCSCKGQRDNLSIQTVTRKDTSMAAISPEKRNAHAATSEGGKKIETR
ncbi:hypothetical protein NQZ68_027276 [Dissostichus eleginoides]|nr:hypothetical protein NQZ68_027276 [Dissostichus eleginoides]